jgi:hypothetical protein
MNRPTVAAFCVSLFAGGILLTAPAALAAPGPDADSPARPAGKWTCWSGDSYFAPRAATPKALWLAGWTAGHVWRYDLKTRQIQVFSALDGLPLDEGPLVRIVAAPDENCAILVSRNLPKPRVFHWNPKDGWRGAPILGDAAVSDIAFDANGDLLALHGSGHSTAIYRLEGKQWRRVYTVPPSNGLVPLADGLAAIEQCGDRSIVHYIPAADPDKLTSTTGPFFNRQHFFYFRAGEKTLCLPNGNVEGISNQSTAHAKPASRRSASRHALAVRAVPRPERGPMVRPAEMGRPGVEAVRQRVRPARVRLLRRRRRPRAAERRRQDVVAVRREHPAASPGAGRGGPHGLADDLAVRQVRVAADTVLQGRARTSADCPV